MSYCLFANTVLVLLIKVFLQPDLQLESWKADSDMYGTTDYGDVQGMHMLRKFGKSIS